MDSEKKEYKISEDITGLCKWMNFELGKESIIYDSAILITRADICKDNHCAIKSATYYGMICGSDENLNCAIIKDEGAILNQVITKGICYLCVCSSVHFNS